MTVLSAARAAARRQDEQLVTLVAQALDPWPVRVFVDENRPGVLRIALGRPAGAYLDVEVDSRKVAQLGALARAASREAYADLLRTRAAAYRDRADRLTAELVELVDTTLDRADGIVPPLEEALACRMVAEELEQRADQLDAL
jgi:hypothetical protein